MGRWCLGVLAVVVLMAADAPKGDMDALQGDWTTKSFIMNGGPLPKAKQFTDRLMTIKGNEFSEFRGGKVAIRGTIKIDPEKPIKWIDATFTEGGPTGETIHGIYQLDGDTLKVCIGTPETDRPSKFESTSGSKLRLIVYERKRP